MVNACFRVSGKDSKAETFADVNEGRQPTLRESSFFWQLIIYRPY